MNNKTSNAKLETHCSPFPPPNTPPAESASPWAALGFFAKILRTRVSKASFTLVFSLAYKIGKRQVEMIKLCSQLMSESKK